MFRPRVLPVLLFKNNGLVKSKQFKDFQYIGDPINAVKIFNDLKADELIFLDISATTENRTIPLEFVKNVGEEANMPFSVGGGIRSITDIQKIIGAGAERVVINSYAATNPDFIQEASNAFGSSTIIVCIDVKKNFWGKERTWIKNGNSSTNYNAVEFAKLMEEKGAGEIIIQSIDRDGTMIGYDIELILKISKAVTIPVVALGGAGNIDHMRDAYKKGYANGLASGSMFVFQGLKKGVLINYPGEKELSLLR